ncbi:MAG TPA: cytochrome c-type biogenesis protein CcmH [Acidisarcina sp.]|nr:cytochrome c-type biogenesis protein CcmH [Acidisarcina sp.]
MKKSSCFSSPALRVVQVVLLSVLVIFSMGASNPGSRFNDLGHRMICSCGCNQVLLECNHVGCPASEGMRNELMAGIDRGDSDNLILQSFVQKYGPTVLAAPSSQGFNRVAWIMPFAVLLLGMFATVLLVRKWKLRTVDMPHVPATPGFERVRDRIRHDTDEFQGDSRP